MSNWTYIVSNSATVTALRSASVGRLIVFALLVGSSLGYAVATELQVGVALSYLVVVGLLLHFVIFSQDVTVPQMYALLFCAAVVPLFHITDIGGTIAFFSGSFYFFHRELKDTKWYHPFPLLVFYAGVLLYVLTLTPLLVGDTTTYFSQLEQYPSVAAYFEMLADRIVADPIWLNNFPQKLPIIYLPFYFSLNLTSPLFIIVINGTLWVLSAMLLAKLSAEYVGPRVSGFSPRLFFALLLMSPTFLLYSSQFNKEISTLFVMVLSVYLFLEKRYLSFCVAAAVLFYFRPYAVVALAVYILFFKQQVRLMGVVAGVALGVLVVDSGTILTALNGLVIFAYMFVSPLPFEVQNWLTLRAALRPLEAAVTGGAAALSLYVVSIDREFELEYVLIAIGLLAWAFTLAWLGYYRIRKGNFTMSTYEFLGFGVHVARKKTLIQPLLLMWVVLVAGAIQNRLLDVRIKFE